MLRLYLLHVSVIEQISSWNPRSLPLPQNLTALPRAGILVRVEPRPVYSLSLIIRDILDKNTVKERRLTDTSNWIASRAMDCSLSVTAAFAATAPAWALILGWICSVGDYQSNNKREDTAVTVPRHCNKRRHFHGMRSRKIPVQYSRLSVPRLPNMSMSNGWN